MPPFWTANEKRQTQLSVSRNCFLEEEVTQQRFSYFVTLLLSPFPGGWFSPRWSSSSSVTGRRWFQTILWGPTPSTRSSNGPTASPWPCKPHATHQAQHHPPPPSAPPYAHPAHAEPRRVKKCLCFSAYRSLKDPHCDTALSLSRLKRRKELKETWQVSQ